jgi:hypothetical protein
MSVRVVSNGVSRKNTQEAGQKAAHVFAGFTFIEQLTGLATNLRLLSNTEHFL